MAGVLAFKESNRKNKFFIYFDKRYAGVTTEKVDLRDSNIRIMFQRVKYYCVYPSTEFKIMLRIGRKDRGMPAS